MEQDFKEKDVLRYFLAIMALFGWGFAEQMEFDPVTGTGTIKIARFPKLIAAQPDPVHDDFSGILARAFQLSFGGKYDVKEMNCCEMTPTGQECVYQIHPLKEGSRGMESKAEVQQVDKVDTKKIENPLEFDKLMDQFSMPESGVLMVGGKPVAKRIVIKDVASINSMFLKTADLIGWKTMGPVCFRVGRNYMLKDMGSKEKIEIKDVEDYLRKLSYFGWGIFEVQKKPGSTYLVVLTNNPFTSGFLAQQVSTDYLVGGFISGLFELLEGKRVNVKEIECVAKGDKRCVFEVTLLSAKKN
jgi:predicted hydrocarbon binding protein